MTDLRLLTADERLAEARGPKILLVGVPGAGKTYQLRFLGAERLAQTLFLDAEAGDLSAIDVKVASVRTRIWTDCRDIACVLGGPNPALPSSAPYSQAHYQNVIANPVLANLARFTILFVDSLTEVSRQCLTWALQQPESVNERGRRDLRATGLLARELVGWLQQVQHDRARTVILVAILERITDDFGRAEWRPQLEGQRTGRELPGIIDEVVTLQHVDFGDGKPIRVLVCTNPNPWLVPAKDRSGKLDQLEPPDLGKLLLKLTSPRSANSTPGETS
jgi:hypothetical protein